MGVADAQGGGVAGKAYRTEAKVRFYIKPRPRRRPSSSPGVGWTFNGQQRPRSSCATDGSASSASARRGARPASGTYLRCRTTGGGVTPCCASAAAVRGEGTTAAALDCRRVSSAKTARRPLSGQACTGGRGQVDGKRAREAADRRGPAAPWSAHKTSGAAPERAGGPTLAWRESPDCFAPSPNSVTDSLDQEGLWWEWQTRGASGWSSLEASVSERLEEAYTLGEPTCRFWKDGHLVVFDLQGAIEALGSSRLRRVRMPQMAVGTASTCSTCWASPAASLEAQESSIAFPSRWADASEPRYYLGNESQEVFASPSKDVMPSTMEFAGEVSQWW
mmetsp:Transcript_100378/g.318774  ORF Transcript_100378/g.318774 Transcript_100378/m.318774 type:complete len:334 (-) Transcript_100378:60-1061(-)